MKTFVTLLVSTLIVLAACGQITGETVREESIKVGVVSPLTGDFGSYGRDIQRGITLALEDIDEPVEVIYEDACLPQEALTAASKLVMVDGVDFITGVFCAIALEPIATYTEPRRMSVMVSSSVADSILETKEWIFSTSIAMRTEAYALAEYAYQEMGARRAATLFYTTPFGVTYDRHFTARFEELGGEVILHEQTPIIIEDVKTPLLKLKAAAPDVILVVESGHGLGRVLKEAAESGLEARMLSTYEAEDPSVLEVAGSAAEGLILSSPGESVKSPAEQRFEERYTKRFGEAPSVVAKTAYDGLILQVDAYVGCRGRRECIAEHIKSVRDFEGASGTFTISEDGTAVKGIQFKRIEDGAFVQLSS